MKAELIERSRLTFDDGMILEMVLWRLSEPVEGCPHRYKYRLFYGAPGKRIVGYDNERPKGDHCHLDGSEQPYQFSTPEKLIADFLADVRQRRSS